MRLKWMIILAVLLIGGPALAESELRVAMSADYPPLHFKQNGEIVGLEPDSASAVGNILKRKVRLIELPFEDLLPALENGKVDVVMSGISITEARSKRVRFTQPYMQMGQMAIMHKNNASRFAQSWSIYREGVRVGVEPNTTGAQFADQQLPKAVVSFFDNPDAAFAGLREDKIDLYVHDAPTSWQLANGAQNLDLISTYHLLTEEQLAWAVSADNAELAEDLNRALATMTANGTLQRISTRWLPVRVEVN